MLEIRTFVPRTVRHTYDGSELVIAIADPLAAGWYDADWPDVPELVPLKASRLSTGARVFDVGAHQCVVAMILAAAVGNDGRVVAVEAEPHNVRIGRRNVTTNGFSNVEVVSAAISDKDGTVRFAASLNGSVDVQQSRASIEVRAVTLDSLVEHYGLPDAVLLDVEGYEQRALQGAGGLLDKRATDFLVELHVGCGLEDAGGAAADIVEMFARRHYVLAVAQADNPHSWTSVTGETEIAARSFLFAQAPGAAKCDRVE